MNSFGLWLGFATLFIIGLGFVWVIRGERYFGYLWWPYAMGAGILSIIATLFISSNWLSALLGAFGASLVWGVHRIKGTGGTWRDRLVSVPREEDFSALRGRDQKVEGAEFIIAV
jgi:hypothetical protein